MARTTRRGKLVIVVLVLAVAAGAGVAVNALWNSAKSSFSYNHCTVGGYDLDTEQSWVAASMAAAVSSYTPKLPDRAAVLALAAALQESKLRNLPPGAGDRDSVGVLQQRPSQGWGGGDPAKLQDVWAATTEFLDHLVKVDGWQSLPLAEAVQRVQISADGSAYAQHETEAAALAPPLLGRVPAGVTCTFDKPTAVATAAAVAGRLKRELPLHTPTVSDRTITVPGAGWQSTAWLVANADRLGIDRVSYAGRTWSRAKGWQDDHSASSARVVAIMALAPKGQ
jgi:hypothetical protein